MRKPLRDGIQLDILRSGVAASISNWISLPQNEGFEKDLAACSRQLYEMSAVVGESEDEFIGFDADKTNEVWGFGMERTRAFVAIHLPVLFASGKQVYIKDKALNCKHEHKEKEELQ